MLTTLKKESILHFGNYILSLGLKSVNPRLCRSEFLLAGGDCPSIMNDTPQGVLFMSENPQRTGSVIMYPVRASNYFLD